MRSFSYFLAAAVVTALFFGALPQLVGRPLARTMRQWIAALPFCGVVIISDREGVVYQHLLGGEGIGSPRRDCSMEVTSTFRGVSVVAIAGLADRREQTVGHSGGSRERGRFAIGGRGVARPHLSRA